MHSMWAWEVWLMDIVSKCTVFLLVAAVSPMIFVTGCIGLMLQKILETTYLYT